MRTRPLASIVLAVAAVLAAATFPQFPGVAQAAPPPLPAVHPKKPKEHKPVVLPSGPADYLVRFKRGTNPNTEAASAQAKGYQVKRTLRRVFPGLVVHLTRAQRDQLVANSKVAYAEPVQQVRAFSGTQTDPPSWGLDRVDNRSLPLNRDYAYGPNGAGVRAYVVDSGIYAAHSDFGARVAAGGDFAGDGRGTDDCTGHGTHVAGTIGGAKYGVAKGVTLVPVRVLNCEGLGSTETVIAGLEWITSHHPGGPAVVNMSIGTDFSQASNDAVQALISAGFTVVVAAGNDGDLACSYSPGSTPDAITVAATDDTDVDAPFSNYGPCVDIYAPGVDIESDVPGSPTASYSASGTSMASPHVAGAAALVLQAQPDWTPAQVSAELLGKATQGVVKDNYSSNRLLYTGGGVTPAPLWPTPAPTLTGTPKADWTLYAHTGVWGPEPVTFSYRWERVKGGEVSVIAGASGASYRLTPADAGSTVRVVVTGTASGFLAVTRTSAPSVLVTGTITAATPSIAGRAVVASRLTATPGNWIPAPISFAYQWYRVSSTGAAAAIPGATAATYMVAPSDLNHTIRVALTGSRPFFPSVTRQSVSPARVAAGTLSAAVPVVSGTPRVGVALLANPGAWGPAPVTLRYQWYRVSATGTATAISGASAASYRAQAADLNQALKVRVTGSKWGYATTARTSAMTARVVPGAIVPQTPSLTGTLRVGYTVAVVPGRWAPAPVSFRYQWYKISTTGLQSVITGATAYTLKPTTALRGYRLRVAVAGVKAGYATAVRWAPVSAAVR